jgi:thymidylate kinase
MLVEADKTYVIIDDPDAAAMRGKDKGASIYDAVEKQRRVQETFLWLADRDGGKRIVIVHNEGKSVKSATDDIYNRMKRELRKQ